MKALYAIVVTALFVSVSAKTTIQNNITINSQIPPRTNAAIPQAQTQQGENCNPAECINVGYCQGYLRCDKKVGKWVREECGENLVWNPLNPNGTNHVHGGNCDTCDNLSDDVVRRYRTDTECLACLWEAPGSCSTEYGYHPANGTQRNVLRLSCAEGLVFSQEKQTCERCEDVKDDDGNACCSHTEFFTAATVVSTVAEEIIYQVNSGNPLKNWKTLLPTILLFLLYNIQYL